MNPLYVVLLGIIMFWVALSEINKRYNLSKYGVDFQGIILLWRTKRFNDFIDSISEKGKKIWSVYSIVGIGAAVVGMITVFYFLFSNAIKVLLSPEPSPGVGFVIPGVTVPFWYSIIGLIVVLIVHEGSHGVIARANNIKLKSTGLALFVAIPGAFVEPDEEELKKTSRLTRMKVYAAGSMANFVTALIAFVLIVGLINPLLTPSGIQIVSIEDSSSAFGLLSQGDIITEINGIKIETLQNFYDIMQETKPGDQLNVVSDKGTFNITLGDHPREPGKGYIGIVTSQYYNSSINMKILTPINGVLFWVFLLNFNIGLINLFPLPFLFDGGKIFKEIVDTKFSEANSNTIQKVFAIIGIMLFAINILPSFL
ncbi:MAG: PDZ domain-containing protein [Candidatus Methanofastidiosa archaeon]|nr:PDZ domain-containing protein [Candidatus Methanofastidiosa archaeon]